MIFDLSLSYLSSKKISTLLPVVPVIYPHVLVEVVVSYVSWTTTNYKGYYVLPLLLPVQ